MIYDCIIIGAGMGGLYISNKLLPKYKSKKIGLFEMGDNYGGRVQTYYKNKITYETGAARFNKHHKLLLGLLRKYNLKNKMIKIPSSWNNINTSSHSTHPKFQDVNHLINTLVKKCQSKSKVYLQSKTLFEICEHLYDRHTSIYLKNNHPYDIEVTMMNGEVAINMFKNDLNEDFDFYLLGGGLSQLTKRLFQDFKSNGGEFNPFHILQSYNYDANTGIFTCQFIFKNQDKIIKTRNLVLAVDGQSIKNIQGIPNIKSTPGPTSIKISPVLRTYSIYPKNSDGKYWFDDIGKVVTDNHLKFIIPYDISRGVIMISYTDGNNAKYWQRKIINNTQQQNINRLLKKTFPNKIIPEPLDTKNYYWDNGMAYWKKNVNAPKIAELMINPSPTIPLFICGDSFSLRQAWMEGALETADKVFKQIKL